MCPDKANSSVARMVDQLIESSGLTQREVAFRTGFEKPNILSMIRHGETKLPLTRAAAFAAACGADPVFVVRHVLQQDHPRVWAALVSSFGEPLTKNERWLLEIYRTVSPECDLDLDDDLAAAVRDALRAEGPPLPDSAIARALLARRGFNERSES